MPSVRKSHLSALLLVAIFCLNGMHAVADTVTTFTATGVFQDGATLSGTIDINVTNGQIASVDLIASAPRSLAFTYLQAQEANYPITGNLTAFIGIDILAGIFPTLNLGFGTNSLVGYMGGNLNSKATPFNAYYVSTIQFSNEDYDLLLSGSLTPATAPAPEPFSLALFSTGLLFPIATLIRRHIADA
jgi:hypothetical protein